MLNRWVFILMTLAACSSPGPSECSSSTQCAGASGGACIAAPSGNHWCLYPDSTCPGGATGRRWSSESEDSLASQCLPVLQLTVSRVGDGAGDIISDPPGVECPTEGPCSGTFAVGSTISLSASATSVSRFVGFSSDSTSCQGDSCIVTLSDNGAVTATFSALPILTLKMLGNGAGSVSSTPTGIACSKVPGEDQVCAAAFDKAIALSPTIGASSVFLGWDGACKGSGACNVDLSSGDATVIAYFGIPSENLWLDQVSGNDGQSNQRVLSVMLGARDAFVFGEVFGGGNSIGGRPIVGRTFVSKLDEADGHAEWVADVADVNCTYGCGAGLDAADNVIVTGLDNSGTHLIVARLSSTDGHEAWRQTFGPFDDTHFTPVRPWAVSVDVDGNPSIVGSFVDAQTIGAFNLSNMGGQDIFVVRLNGNTGNVSWARSVGGAGDDEATGVSTDAERNVVLTGSYVSAFALDPGHVLTSSGRSRIFVAKLAAANGNALFSRDFGSTETIFGTNSNDVVVDLHGNLVVTGFYTGSFDVGAGVPLPAPPDTGVHDEFVLSVSPAGAVNWATAFQGPRSELNGLQGASPAISQSDGNVLVTGSFFDEMTIGTHHLAAAGLFDVYIAKVSSADGTVVFGQRFGGTANEMAASVCEDANHRLYAGGTFNGFADFRGVTLTSTGGEDGYVVQLAPSVP